MIRLRVGVNAPKRIGHEGSAERTSVAANLFVDQVEDLLPPGVVPINLDAARARGAD